MEEEFIMEDFRVTLSENWASAHPALQLNGEPIGQVVLTGTGGEMDYPTWAKYFNNTGMNFINSNSTNMDRLYTPGLVQELIDFTGAPSKKDPVWTFLDNLV